MAVAAERMADGAVLGLMSQWLKAPDIEGQGTDKASAKMATRFGKSGWG